ncbi:hypothetical protein RCL1_009084 [Eukaryota sp. TZLM3-RCL]
MNHDYIILDMCIEDTWETELSLNCSESVKQSLSSLLLMWKLACPSPYIPRSSLTLRLVYPSDSRDLLSSSTSDSFDLSSVISQLETDLVYSHTNSYSTLASSIKHAISQSVRSICVLSMRSSSSHELLEAIQHLQNEGILLDWTVLTLDSPIELSHSSSLVAETTERGIDVVGFSCAEPSFLHVYTVLSNWLNEHRFQMASVVLKSCSFELKVYMEALHSLPVISTSCSCHGKLLSVHNIEESDCCPRIKGLFTSLKGSSCVEIGQIGLQQVHHTNPTIPSEWTLLVSRRVPLSTISLGLIRGGALLALPELSIDFDQDNIVQRVYTELLQGNQALVLKGDASLGCSRAQLRDVSNIYWLLLPETTSFAFTLLPISSIDYIFPIRKHPVPIYEQEEQEKLLDAVPLSNLEVNNLRSNNINKIINLLRNTRQTVHQQPMVSNMQSSVPSMSNAFLSNGSASNVGSISSIKPKKGITFKRISVLESDKGGRK